MQSSSRRKDTAEMDPELQSASDAEFVDTRTVRAKAKRSRSEIFQDNICINSCNLKKLNDWRREKRWENRDRGDFRYDGERE